MNILVLIRVAFMSIHKRSSSDKAYISLVDMITKAKFSNSPNDFKIRLFG